MSLLESQRLPHSKIQMTGSLDVFVNAWSLTPLWHYSESTLQFNDIIEYPRLSYVYRFWTLLVKRRNPQITPRPVHLYLWQGFSKGADPAMGGWGVWNIFNKKGADLQSKRLLETTNISEPHNTSTEKNIWTRKFQQQPLNNYPLSRAFLAFRWSCCVIGGRSSFSGLLYHPRARCFVRGQSSGSICFTAQVDSMLKSHAIPDGIKMRVSDNGGTPQIIHFNRVFHYKPPILGVPLFLEIPKSSN